MKTKLKIKAILYHGATLSTAELRRAGVKSALPKPEQYHPEFIVEQNGKRYLVSAPITMQGCGRMLFYTVWDKR
jgi:hypothetical protein